MVASTYLTSEILPTLGGPKRVPICYRCAAESPGDLQGPTRVMPFVKALVEPILTHLHI